jgi:uncharacterized membrane protein YoaK (UPF0700 family)
MTLGLLLTAAAGFTDVVGFIELGGYYTSFMSGNTTQLGEALSQAQFAPLLLPISLVALFFLGSFLGSLLALHDRRWGQPRVTAFVAICMGTVLALAAQGLPATQTMLVLAAGAGAQNAILPAEGAARLGATFVTGTLFSAGQDLARALYGLAPAWRWLQHALVWASLLGGALIGALAYHSCGVLALLAPFLVYLGFLLNFVRKAMRSVEER